MDDTGNTRDDLKLPDGEIGAEIKAAIADGKDILVSTFLSIFQIPNTLSTIFKPMKELTFN